MKTAHEILTDFTALAENEVQRIRTGFAPGPSMRDCLGQWQATIREAKDYLAETNLPPLPQMIAQRRAQIEAMAREAASPSPRLLPEQFEGGE